MIWQPAPGGREPPASENVAAPAVAVSVPRHVLVGTGVAAMTVPPGKEKAPDKFAAVWKVEELKNETVRVDVPFTKMVLGANSVVTLTCA